MLRTMTIVSLKLPVIAVLILVLSTGYRRADFGAIHVCGMQRSPFWL